MKKKWKDKWIKALLSGKYVQGKRELCTEGKEYDKFCCLGVLCDIAGPDRWGISKFETSGGGSEVYWGVPATSDLPPSFLLLDVGLKFQEAETLARMNDDGNKFKTIAKYIEKNL
jgi:hypothetical protein